MARITETKENEGTEKQIAMRKFARELPSQRLTKYGDESEDWSFVPKEAVPDGCVVQWIVHTVLGKPVEPYEIQRFTMNGWTPFPLDLYPSLMPDGYKGTGVERNGQMLYIRRKELSDEARREETLAARGQLSSRLQENGLASLPNSSAPRTKASVKASYEAIQVED